MFVGYQVSSWRYLGWFLYDRARLWYRVNLSGIWVSEGLKELVAFGEAFPPVFLILCDGFKKSNVAGYFQPHCSQPH